MEQSSIAPEKADLTYNRFRRSLKKFLFGNWGRGIVWTIFWLRRLEISLLTYKRKYHGDSRSVRQNNIWRRSLSCAPHLRQRGDSVNKWHQAYTPTVLSSASKACSIIIVEALLPTSYTTGYVLAQICRSRLQYIWVC